jgi:hypothetical protein
VTALRLTCSNTESFVANIFDNDITVTGTHDSIMNIYGIHFDDWEASGEVRNNTLLLTGPRSVTGVSTYGADEISGNDITGIITTDYLTAKGYGIYSLAGNAGSNDYIFDNTISLSTNRNNISLYGIHAQSGKIRHNRITATHSGDSGKVYGLTTDYYQIHIENNSILLSSAGASEYGIAFNTHYNDTKTSYLKNNILQGSAGGISKGIYKSTGYLASVVNSYNTVYNFSDGYDGLTAGTGSLTSDPEFADAELHLSPGSPAIDAGDWASPYANEPAPNGGRINMGAYGNTASATVSAPFTLYAGSDGNCGTKVPCYSKIQDAIDDAATGDVILVRQGRYPESLRLGANKTLLIKGGYNETFGQQTADTTFIEAAGPTAIEASGGSLRFQMISVK